MISLLLGLLALALELSAWSNGWLPAAGAPDMVLARYLMLHAAASVLLPLALLPFVPRYAARSRAAMVAFMAACIFSVPLLGFVTVLAAFPILLHHQRRQRLTHFDSLTLPEFDQAQHSRTRFRHAGLRNVLGSEEAPEPVRMRAMAVLQHVTGRTAAPLLRSVLADANEDLRLLAYGILDNLEKRINEAITAERQALSQVADASPEAVQIMHRLSDLYWELVYQGLVEGDLRAHAIAQSLAYCEQALQHAPDQASLHLRRGRLLHEQGQRDPAGQAYARARELGVPATRVVPYQAQLLFEQRDLVGVRALMQELSQWQALPSLQPVIRYWSQP